ncbi:hypothetical protein GCM10010182_67290 [Actinomadura cremea]|nr:hypothetical protein GCM10010182_67290 [Actinomadura cremea]
MTATDRASAGTCDPEEGAPMPAYAAVWVRAHVWTQAMRNAIGIPTCACHWGMTQHCANGDHHRCHRATPQPFPHTYITDRDGHVPLDTVTAQVWLADRTCRWVCPCSCGHQPPKPAKAKAARPARKPKPPAAPPPLFEDVHLPGDGALFDLETA